MVIWWENKLLLSKTATFNEIGTKKTKNKNNFWQTLRDLGGECVGGWGSPKVHEKFFFFVFLVPIPMKVALLLSKSLFSHHMTMEKVGFPKEKIVFS